MKFSTKNKSQNELFNIYDKNSRRLITLLNFKKKLILLNKTTKFKWLYIANFFKNNVKNEIIRYDNNIENIKNFIKISNEFDDKFYEKIMKKHYDLREKSNIYVETSNFRDNNNKSQRNDINYEITSIKLNVTMRRKKKNLKKK